MFEIYVCESILEVERVFNSTHSAQFLSRIFHVVNRGLSKLTEFCILRFSRYETGIIWAPQRSGARQDIGFAIAARWLSTKQNNFDDYWFTQANAILGPEDKNKYICAKFGQSKKYRKCINKCETFIIVLLRSPFIFENFGKIVHNFRNNRYSSRYVMGSTTYQEYTYIHVIGLASTGIP